MKPQTVSSSTWDARGRKSRKILKTHQSLLKAANCACHRLLFDEPEMLDGGLH